NLIARFEGELLLAAASVYLSALPGYSLSAISTFCCLVWSDVNSHSHWLKSPTFGNHVKSISFKMKKSEQDISFLTIKAIDKNLRIPADLPAPAPSPARSRQLIPKSPAGLAEGWKGNLQPNGRHRSSSLYGRKR
uniref:Uncharacterized protein n=1 Tax=Accipiter nisus TaxID=211598 RepID=A0A8B9LXY3_9AVES